MNSKYLDGELGLLKIKVLAVHIPQKPITIIKLHSMDIKYMERTPYI